MDNLIIAIGSTINKNDFIEELINGETGLMIVNENYETNQENIFAGGDIINNKGTVASAIYDGICVAKQIIEKEKHNLYVYV